MLKLFCCAIVAWIVSCAVADVASDKFIAWFKSNGGQVHGLTISEFPHMGNGFQALKTVNEGSMILQIPRELQFSVEQMKSNADKSVKKLSALVTDGDIAIAAWILLEKYRGEKSFFAPYIKVLPSHVSSVLYFSSEELEAIQEPDFIEQIKEFQQTTTQEFERLSTIVRSDKSGLLKVLADNLKQEDYVWACTIINSRGLRFRGQVYLSPMADVFNYAPHPQPRIAQNGDHFLKHHILHPNNGTLTILSDRTCAAGQQCLEDYGDNPNQIYLQYHDFVPQENPFNCLRIFAQNALLTFRNDLIINNLKMKIVTKLGLDRPFNDCINESGMVSRSMGGLLAIASLNAEDVEACLEVLSTSSPNYKEALQICKVEQTISFLQKRASSSPMDDEISSEDAVFYAQILQNARKMLQAEISRNYRFDSTYEEDSQLLSAQFSSATAPYMNLAIRYRMSNKQLTQRLVKVLGNHEEQKKSAKLAVTLDASTGTASLDKSVHDNNADGNSKVATSSDSSEDLEFALNRFNDWFNAAKPQVNKLKAVAMPRYRIGTITTEAVSAEETYVSVPTSIIMDSEKAFLYSGISPLLQSLSMKYKTRDDFHELLFFLIYETFVQHANSVYWPYLAVLPRVQDVQVPLIWEQEEIMRVLNPSFMAPTAVNYRSRTLKKFEFLSNLKEVKEFYDPLEDVSGNPVFTLERYLWATAILDSRSIWWSGRRHLVPMLDFINCEEHASNPKRVHATTLDATEKFAVTKAGTDYQAGDQLFENYGQPNHIYYLYHGFILEENTHDCVSFEISFSTKEWQTIRNHGVNDYIEQLGISDRNRKYATCLSSPINPEVWNVVGLMSDVELETNENGLKLPNSPTISSAKRLRKLLKDRLALYKDVKCGSDGKAQNSDMPWKHIAANMFLCSEKVLLNNLVNHVRDLLSELENGDL